MKMLSLERQGEIRKKYKGHADVQELLRELKRLRKKYVGTDLPYLSPIAERCGRRVGILVNCLRSDSAHLAVDECFEEQKQMLSVLQSKEIRLLPRVPRRMMQALRTTEVENLAELLLLSPEQIDALGLTPLDIHRVLEAVIRAVNWE